MGTVSDSRRGRAPREVRVRGRVGVGRPDIRHVVVARDAPRGRCPLAATTGARWPPRPTPKPRRSWTSLIRGDASESGAPTRHALAQRRGTHSRTDPRRPRPHAARSTRADDRSSTPPGRPREARAPDTRTRSFQPLISTPRAPGIITMRSEGVSTLERAAPPNLSTRSTRIHDRLKPSFLDTYTVSRDDLKRPTPSHRPSLAVHQISRPPAPRIPATRRPAESGCW